MRTIENNSGTATAHVQTPFFQKESKGFFNSGASSSFFHSTGSSGTSVQTSSTAGKTIHTGERKEDEKTNSLTQSKSQTGTQSMCTECAEKEKLQRKENKPEQEAEEAKSATAASAEEEKSAPQTNNPTPPLATDQQEDQAPKEADHGAVSGNYLSPIVTKEEEAEQLSQTMPAPATTYSFVQAAPALQMVPQVQTRANVVLAPADLTCILMDTTGTSGTLDILFDQDDAALDGGDLTNIENFVGGWVGRGLSEDLTVSGFASEEGTQRHNWRLSCNRAQAVHAELARIGVPDSKITTFAHGETTDFDSVNHEPNRRATITTTSGTGPVITPVLTPLDNFPGRSTSTFGIGEQIVPTYTATPSIAAAEHFGVEWRLAFGSGSVVNTGGSALYTAGNATGIELLTLNVTSGPAAGIPLAVALPFVTAPTSSYMTQVPASGLCHTTGTPGVGFRGNIFMLPTSVSFSNVQWREGNGTTIAFGSLSGLNGNVHPTGAWMSIAGGNSTTGCQVNTVDTVFTNTSAPNFSIGGFTDWSGAQIWPIEWQYSVGGGAATPYMTAFHICTINSAGTANISKAGAGPFTKAIGDGTTTIAAIPAAGLGPGVC